MKHLYKYLVFILIIGICKTGLSNSHTPISLKTLIADSDLIIVGKVISTKEINSDSEFKISDFWEAKVKIIEVVKGDSTYFNKIITIGFSKNIPCTGSAEYSDSLFVLSFLSVDVDNDFYTVHGPYGVKNLDKNGIDIYKERISKFNELGGQEMNSSKLIDWYINCLSSPITSWEGAYELSAKTQYQGGKDSIIYKTNLSNKQFEKLRQTILNIKHLQYQDIQLLPLIYSDNDSELLIYTANQIDTSTYDNVIRSEYTMFKMNSLLKNNKLENLLLAHDSLIKAYLKTNYYDDANKKNELNFQKESIKIYKKFQKTLLEISKEKIEIEQPIKSNSKNYFFKIILILFSIIGIFLFLKKILSIKTSSK